MRTKMSGLFCLVALTVLLGGQVCACAEYVNTITWDFTGNGDSPKLSLDPPVDTARWHSYVMWR
jgi:hypothetical protein